MANLEAYMRHRGARALPLLVALVSGLVHGSTMQVMSFEEATKEATVVVLARVIESPEFGTRRVYPTGTALIVRRHRVMVDEYLKGEGPTEIVIDTIGGKFITEVHGKPQTAYQVAGGQPQLPEDGEEVLLFLAPRDDGSYMISSASHGVVPTALREGERVVQLAVSERSLLPARIAESHPPDAGAEPSALVSTSVPVSELRALVQRVLAPKQRSAATSK